MSEFRAQKVVSSLPATLQANTLYFVRTGNGFDLYCSDQTGSIAHKINQPVITYGAAPPNNNDGTPEGSIYIQII